MATNQSPTDPDALLSSVQRIKENYQEPPPPPPKLGKKHDFSAFSFLLLAAVAVTLRTFSDSELRRLLEKYERLRQAIGFERVSHRTTTLKPCARRVAHCRHRIQVVEKRLSRLGPRLQARSARGGLPASSPDLRDLASEQRERS